MLRLSDSELDIVFAAARPLAVQDRDAFLRDVAERLAALPHLGDGVVHRMCAEVQRRHWDAPDLGEKHRRAPLRAQDVRPRVVSEKSETDNRWAQATGTGRNRPFA